MANVLVVIVPLERKDSYGHAAVQSLLLVSIARALRERCNSRELCRVRPHAMLTTCTIATDDAQASVAAATFAVAAIVCCRCALSHAFVHALCFAKQSQYPDKFLTLSDVINHSGNGKRSGKEEELVAACAACDGDQL